MAWVSPLLLRPESAAIFQSRLPGTSHLKAPFETDRAMEKHLDFWEMGPVQALSLLYSVMYALVTFH